MVGGWLVGCGRKGGIRVGLYEDRRMVEGSKTRLT